MEMVSLKNGSSEPRPIVEQTLVTLRTLQDLRFEVFAELVNKCRDEKYKYTWPGVRKQLRELGLLQPDGEINASVRNVVLSGVKGSVPMYMKVVNPIKRERRSKR